MTRFFEPDRSRLGQGILEYIQLGLKNCPHLVGLHRVPFRLINHLWSRFVAPPSAAVDVHKASTERFFGRTCWLLCDAPSHNAPDGKTIRFSPALDDSTIIIFLGTFHYTVRVTDNWLPLWATGRPSSACGLLRKL